MNTQEIMGVSGLPADMCGLLVFWELTGMVDLDDLREALASNGFDADTYAPQAPTLDVALARAAAGALTSKRQLLRPLSRRGAWEVVLEKVVAEDADDRERCTYTSQLTGWVEKTGDTRAAVVHGDADLRDAVLIKVKFYENVLTPSDFSSWLLGQANKMHAIGLRDRGGFYFIPRDRVDEWKRLVNVVRQCSQHQCREIPAMKTDEAVEAILASVSAEATASMANTESWLAGDKASIRGLDAEDRHALRIREKLDHYCKILGRSMPDLEARLERLTGAIQAARILKKADNAP